MSVDILPASLAYLHTHVRLTRSILLPPLSLSYLAQGHLGHQHAAGAVRPLYMGEEKEREK